VPLDGSHYRVTCCACSSSAVTPVLPNAQPDRGGIAHRLRPLGQGREVPMGCGRWRVSSMCSINRRRAATFWRDRPSPLAMSMSDRISASICRTARSKARLSRTFSSSPRATLNERSREPVGDHSDRARGSIERRLRSLRWPRACTNNSFVSSHVRTGWRAANGWNGGAP
jgi:hypothetical protein